MEDSLLTEHRKCSAKSGRETLSDPKARLTGLKH
jgi:hypothetical protein